MKLPQINEVVVNSKIKELSILHLSDLHINKKTSTNSINQLVKLCNRSEADFIVITGDIIDCKVKFIKERLELLNKIEKKTYYISGNHDLFYGFKELKNILTNLICLDNNYEILQIKDKTIAIGGLSDRFSKFFRVKREEDKIVKILSKYENSIFLAHQPKDYIYALKSNSKLFLCGHTHGGQIYPFHYVVKLFQPFLNGLIYKKDTAIYVSKGIGNWGIDFRFKANNEISLLKLR
ncbi:metallophosphoesterase [Halarcobacter sp.]|uniref:metallophosphoesterase n=1 Tax=Halarcobacter sp. TaxID=2321133 RepID=UPI002AA77BBA|nr:metallophosphoesterase [Halarcobacter sp.]